MWARSDGRFEKSVLQVYNRIGALFIIIIILILIVMIFNVIT